MIPDVPVRSRELEPWATRSHQGVHVRGAQALDALPS